jgi:hypothetical protein
MLYARFSSSCSASSSISAYQDLNLCTGITYHFSAWLRRVSTASACSAVFSVDGVNFATTTAWAGTGWSQVSGSYTATKSTGRLSVEMKCEGSNYSGCRELYVDDVVFTAV